MADRFEDAMKKLEEIVVRMERGDMSLDDSLKMFEEGVRLTGFCSRELQKAEKKVEKLTRDARGALTAVPFEEEEDEE